MSAALPRTLQAGVFLFTLTLAYVSTIDSLIVSLPRLGEQLVDIIPGLVGGALGLALPDGRWLLIVVLSLYFMLASSMRALALTLALLFVSAMGRTIGVVERDDFNLWFHPIGIFITEVILLSFAVVPFAFLRFLLNRRRIGTSL